MYHKKYQAQVISHPAIHVMLVSASILVALLFVQGKAPPGEEEGVYSTIPEVFPGSSSTESLYEEIHQIGQGTPEKSGGHGFVGFFRKHKLDTDPETGVPMITPMTEEEENRGLLSTKDVLKQRAKQVMSRFTQPIKALTARRGVAPQLAGSQEPGEPSGEYESIDDFGYETIPDVPEAPKGQGVPEEGIYMTPEKVTEEVYRSFKKGQPSVDDDDGSGESKLIDNPLYSGLSG
ncbi:hypothetical protein RF11_01479 [Thelohanellus kitauei]|uniref:Uncharacterized protein n=1 Tax=Thelohanellus kitauei TaxID=669202 RepID=A0A0C2IZB4_THEKT|nr:hypothetical protein RF11_01479 [Thelohanellus kitauei]